MSPVWPVLLLLAAVTGKPTGAVATLEGLGPSLTACFQAPDRSAGSQVTVRFSLRRDGTVLGRPAIAFAKLVGGAEDRKAFVAAALGALAACTPVHLAPGLGDAIAGRVLTVRFVGGGPAKDI